MRPTTLRRLSGEALALVAELHRIAQRGEPAAIRDLMPFATSPSGAREAIERLFAAIPHAALPILDGWPRWWPGSPDLRAHDIRGIEVAGNGRRLRFRSCCFG